MAVFLGILGFVFGFIGGILFGVIGGIIAVVLGVLAIVVCVRDKKKDDGKKRGSAGIIIGAIAVLSGVMVIPLFLNVGDKLKDMAAEKNLTNLEICAPGFKYGIVGFSARINKEGLDADVVSDELSWLTDSLKEEESE